MNKGAHMPTEIATKPTKAIVTKILDLLSYGLVAGLGKQKPGEMCVEAVVCAAYELPHNDNPPCVGLAVRSLKIALNDCGWSSTTARANGMRRFAIAQLGSNELDQMAFGKAMFPLGTQRLLPIVFRKVADDPGVKEEHKEGYRKHADECERVTTHDEAGKAVKDASAYASAYAYAGAYYSAYYSAYASASASASSYASASTYTRWSKENLGDKFLELIAAIAVEILIEMKSPGCEWLHLCEAK